MSSNENESETRARRIDPQLEAQGWCITPLHPGRPQSHCTRHAVTEYPTANGPADYALFVGGQPFGIVEAKKVTLGPQNALTQAERSSSLDFHRALAA